MVKLRKWRLFTITNAMIKVRNVILNNLLKFTFRVSGLKVISIKYHQAHSPHMIKFYTLNFKPLKRLTQAKCISICSIKIISTLACSMVTNVSAIIIILLLKRYHQSVTCQVMGTLTNVVVAFGE